MNKLTSFFSVNKKEATVSIEDQRKMWLKEFLKAFLVVFSVYASMYLIRNNLKAGQPLLKEQLGFTTSELGYIGFGFSITYALGKTLLGYFIDGKNAKRIVSFLLMMSATMVFVIGLILISGNKCTGAVLLLWGLSGFFQAPGGPSAYSTITRWTPTNKRGRYLGFWNMSHNIGGALAGMLALWGANKFFHGNVAGMFIVPSIIAAVIGFTMLFVGKDEPEELGWNCAEEIFGEVKAENSEELDNMSKFEVFKKYVLKNPWIWVLCVANVFVYIVRIGIDNWAPLYVTEQLHFAMGDAVNTIFYFETGALIGSLSWGFISDLLKGRRAIVAVFCLVLTGFAVLGYRYATSVTMVNVSLCALGALIFGPQLLIGVSLVGFAPKKAIAVANGLSGTFGYLFGDSTAKVMLAKIADPKSSGVNIGGMCLHGWNDVFIIFYGALIIGICLLLVVAYGEEKKIRSLNKEEKEVEELAA
ncbi:hexose-6-phosphate:phosphate antiporter [Clostridium botulinum]|uniref:hexose-6-phosphate:phosphate antiporter n=1 Tax=Clostridium TaxID=1485 RepID=UPI0002E1E8C6|nr:MULTISPECIES: hexose-6-phosphate:phosphate antiporter [Clostridium]KAI3348483.1 hexose-6-phosphate:phosphate antiporter [Clostridium botulinum]KFX58164.1 antiporter [Clostridium botulinum]KFX59056.1 antiporter [Clostridium botulinum]KON12693.1 antiporter [Clostridium botulinum]MBN1051490.1 hexose-6-phosphate:phosphate antiporter [Clostridium botulinum]